MSAKWSKQTYEMVARVLKQCDKQIYDEEVAPCDVWLRVWLDFANIFEADNPRFDRTRFIKASIYDAERDK